MWGDRMSKGLVLAVTPSIKLRENQAKLYKFIVDKHKSAETINLQEVVGQYSKYGNRMVYNGKPCYYDYDWQRHTHVVSELKGDLLRSYAIQWFIRNLGVFVIKGLLTAIPTIELSQLQIEPDQNITKEDIK